MRQRVIIKELHCTGFDLYIYSILKYDLSLEILCNVLDLASQGQPGTQHPSSLEMSHWASVAFVAFAFIYIKRS
jgi:hypothetical protein